MCCLVESMHGILLFCLFMFLFLFLKVSSVHVINDTFLSTAIGPISVGQ